MIDDKKEIDKYSFLIKHPFIEGRYCVGEEAFWEAIREYQDIEEARENLKGEDWKKQLGDR